MEMDDELERFIKEQRAKVAEDKASLDQDPPYMEIRTNAHNAYDSTIKENIPPCKRSTVQEKEDGYCLSLPLGVDYERKKQKLQQELRMDYRRYMAQKNRLNTGELGLSFPPGERGPVKQPPLAPPVPPEGQRSPRPPEDRPPSRKDASTLTEGRRGVRRALRPIEGHAPWLKEGPPLAPRERARPGRRADYEEDEEYTEEEDELELVEGRRLRHLRLEPGAEKRRPRRHYRDVSRLRDRRAELSDEDLEPNDNQLRTERERKEAGGKRASRRSRPSTNKDEAEFATGLMIGEADRESAVQRRKERYRQELQEQIAEQQRNKKREKDLDLKVAATGATDPEKQPDRIRQFAAIRRRAAAPGRGEASSGPPGHDTLCLGERERLPPEQPRVAFQSPLLEYSAVLGLSPYGQPLANAFPRGMDTPRLPAFPPHPPPTLPDAYRGPYDDAYHYYGARNPLDPNLHYYGPLPMTGGSLPMSYLSVPPGGALSSQMGHHSPHSPHSPHSQHSGSSHPEPPTLRPGGAATSDLGIMVFPAETARPSKESVLSYKEALKQQIQERQERLCAEREEKERYEARLEADMKKHQPWGRGGGGAPLRDGTGNLITDLHQMHKLNEEAYIHPEQWQKRSALSPRREDRPPSSDRVSGFAHVHTPQFARGSVFSNQPTPQQLQEQDKYKAYLKQQIEEKRCKQAEERERVKEEEEKEERRLAEQRAHIQREFEEEQGRKKRKEMEQKAKNEELIRLAEERRKEVERKKEAAEEKEDAALRRQYEQERQARLEVPREPSPPIPTLLKRHGAPHYTPTPPPTESRRSTAPLSERSLSGLQSPPVPARRNQLRAAEDQRGVFNELSALRCQLRSEQKRLEGQLFRSEWEELESPLSDRRRERPPVDVFDMARLRLQAPVRRASSRTTEPSNLLRIHDSLQLQYTDGEAPRDGEESLDRQAELREQQQRFNSLRRRRTEEDYFVQSPPLQNYHLAPMQHATRGSLLQSESAFINPLGDAYPTPPSPERRTPQLSARERRRLAKRTEPHHERGVSQKPVGQPESFSLHSESSLNGERERQPHPRTGRLLALSRHRPGPLEPSSDDEPSPQASPRGRSSSLETVATEPWMRPGTSDTLKQLMSGASRRERLAMQESSAARDWPGPSTYHG